VKSNADLDSILLTRSELLIMKVVWDEGAVTVKEAHQILSQNRSIAYTTVMTFMQILERKGALSRTRSGRAFIYTPLLSRQQATRNHVHDAIERFFDGRPERLLAEVLHNEALSPEQLGCAKDCPGFWMDREAAY
jgi:BlaI family transcriptional regulator, penicillinase repressor